jgi:hypothetical protein
MTLDSDSDLQGTRKYDIIAERRVRMRFYLLACLGLFCIPASAEDSFKAILPEAEMVSEKENFTWNKWETENFIILSIEKSHGLEIKRSVESMKDSYFARWGFEGRKPSGKCKLICVPDEETLKRFFGIDAPRAEARSGSGNFPVCAIWVDFKRLDELPSLMSFVCSSEYFSSNKNRWFVQRGVSLLSLPVPKVKAEISGLEGLDFSEISSCDHEKWLLMSPQNRSLFDRRSALVCLMLRKEFGFDRFASFLLNEQGEKSVNSVYGFEDLEKFNATLRRYSENLTRDIESGSTPDSYVAVQGAKDD